MAADKGSKPDDKKTKDEQAAADYEADLSSPQGICADVKAQLLAGVEGTICEKILYYVLLLGVLLLFFSGVITLIVNATSQHITNVSVVSMPSVPMPAAAFCWQALPRPGESTVGISIKINTDAGCTQEKFAEFGLQTPGQTPVCIRGAYTRGPNEPQSTNTAEENRFFKELYKHSPADDYFDCGVLNFDGALSATPGKILSMTFANKKDDLNAQTWNATDPVGYEPTWYGMLFDPAMAKANLKQVTDTIVLNKMHGLNAINSMAFSYDVSIQRESFTWNAPDDSADLDGDNQTNLYNTVVSWVPKKQWFSHSGFSLSTDETTRFDIFAMSFVSRRIVTRRLSFMEFWAGIGGIWASALLVLHIFFAQKVGGRNGHVMIFKFRTPAGRKALARAAAEKFWESYSGKVEKEFDVSTSV